MFLSRKNFSLASLLILICFMLTSCGNPSGENKTSGRNKQVAPEDRKMAPDFNLVDLNGKILKN